MLVSVSTALPDALMPCSRPRSLAAALSCPAVINLTLTASSPCLKMAASRIPARRSIPASPPCWDAGACKANPLSPAAWANTESCGHPQQGWHSKTRCGPAQPELGAGNALPPANSLCWSNPSPGHPNPAQAGRHLGTLLSSSSALLQTKLATDFLPQTQKLPSTERRQSGEGEGKGIKVFWGRWQHALGASLLWEPAQ